MSNASPNENNEIGSTGVEESEKERIERLSIVKKEERVTSGVSNKTGTPVSVLKKNLGTTVKNSFTRLGNQMSEMRSDAKYSLMSLAMKASTLWNATDDDVEKALRANKDNDEFFKQRDIIKARRKVKEDKIFEAAEKTKNTISRDTLGMSSDATKRSSRFGDTGQFNSSGHGGIFNTSQIGSPRSGGVFDVNQPYMGDRYGTNPSANSSENDILHRLAGAIGSTQRAYDNDSNRTNDAQGRRNINVGDVVDNAFAAMVLDMIVDLISGKNVQDTISSHNNRNPDCPIEGNKENRIAILDMMNNIMKDPSLKARMSPDSVRNSQLDDMFYRELAQRNAINEDMVRKLVEKEMNRSRDSLKSEILQEQINEKKKECSEIQKKLVEAEKKEENTEKIKEELSEKTKELEELGKKYKEKTDALETDLSKKEKLYKDAAEQANKLSGEINDTKQELEKTSKILEEKNKEVEENKKHLEEKEKEIENIKKELEIKGGDSNTLSEKLKTTEVEKKQLEEKQSDLSTEFTKLEAEKKKLESEAKNKEQEVKDLRKEVSEKVVELDNAKDRITDLETQLAKEKETKKDLETGGKEKEAELEEKYKAEVEKLKAELEAKKTKEKKLEDVILEKESKTKKLETALQEKEKNEGHNNLEKEEFIKENEKLKEQFKTERIRYEQIEAEVKEKQIELERLRTEFEKETLEKEKIKKENEETKKALNETKKGQSVESKINEKLTMARKGLRDAVQRMPQNLQEQHGLVLDYMEETGKSVAALAKDNSMMPKQYSHMKYHAIANEMSKKSEYSVFLRDIADCKKALDDVKAIGQKVGIKDTESTSKQKTKPATSIGASNVKKKQPIPVVRCDSIDDPVKSGFSGLGSAKISNANSTSFTPSGTNARKTQKVGVVRN